MLFDPDEQINNRMSDIAESIFQTHDDQNQIPIEIATRTKLKLMTPYWVTYEIDSDGTPITWVLNIPTTRALADVFLKGDISEKELFEATQSSDAYDAVYLCSIITNPQYRGKGYARKLVADTMKVFHEQYGITRFFYWAFSDQGQKLGGVLQKMHPEFKIEERETD